MTDPNKAERARAETALMKNLANAIRKEPDVPKEDKSTDDIARLPRVSVDFRIPLPWLIGGAGAVLWGLISMFFTLQRVSDSVNEMQITVKANNTTTNQYAGEQALLRFRLDKLEQEVTKGAK